MTLEERLKSPSFRSVERERVGGRGLPELIADVYCFFPEKSQVVDGVTSTALSVDLPIMTIVKRRQIDYSRLLEQVEEASPKEAIGYHVEAELAQVDEASPKEVVSSQCEVIYLINILISNSRRLRRQALKRCLTLLSIQIEKPSPKDVLVSPVEVICLINLLLNSSYKLERKALKRCLLSSLVNSSRKASSKEVIGFTDEVVYLTNLFVNSSCVMWRQFLKR
ncbi:Uncharacterized protein Fot_42759 [Forsythia ovata]|uniref:Uncharacterized protein n=1 Tax=Forsythia ovata TaxID=205694 RepID=A0ABD1RM36_9LAMI